MSIADLGAIGEFIASIAVLITLIVLVLESKRNTKLLQRSNSKDIFFHNGQTLMPILDPDNTEMYLRGHNEGMPALNPVERYRFDLLFVPWLQSCEQAFSDYREGMFPLDQFEVFENSVAAWLTTEGGSEWWTERNVWFGRKFQEEVELLLKRNIAEAHKAGPQPQNNKITPQQ